MKKALLCLLLSLSPSICFAETWSVGNWKINEISWEQYKDFFQKSTNYYEQIAVFDRFGPKSVNAIWAYDVITDKEKKITPSGWWAEGLFTITDVQVEDNSKDIGWLVKANPSADEIEWLTTNQPSDIDWANGSGLAVAEYIQSNTSKIERLPDQPDGWGYVNVEMGDKFLINEIRSTTDMHNEGLISVVDTETKEQIYFGDYEGNNKFFGSRIIGNEIAFFSGPSDSLSTAYYKAVLTPEPLPILLYGLGGLLITLRKKFATLG